MTNISQFEIDLKLDCTSAVLQSTLFVFITFLMTKKK